MRVGYVRRASKESKDPPHVLKPIPLHSHVREFGRSLRDITERGLVVAYASWQKTLYLLVVRVERQIS